MCLSRRAPWASASLRSSASSRPPRNIVARHNFRSTFIAAGISSLAGALIGPVGEFRIPRQQCLALPAFVPVSDAPRRAAGPHAAIFPRGLQRSVSTNLRLFILSRHRTPQPLPGEGSLESAGSPCRHRPASPLSSSAGATVIIRFNSACSWSGSLSLPISPPVCMGRTAPARGSGWWRCSRHGPACRRSWAWLAHDRAREGFRGVGRGPTPTRTRPTERWAGLGWRR